MDNLNIFKGFQKPLLKQPQEQPIQPTEPTQPVQPTQQIQQPKEQYDRGAIAIARAIRKQESNHNYEIGLNGNKAGGSGEIGAYQFMPETYRSLARKYLGDDNAPATPQNQDQLAYKQIKEWKDKGMSPSQIAAAWNAGEGSITGDAWKNRVGVNEYGVRYDTPSYVNNVMRNFAEIAEQDKQRSVGQQTGSTEQQIDPYIALERQQRIAQGLPISVNENRVDPTFAGSLLRGIASLPVRAAAAIGGGVKRLVNGNIDANDPTQGVTIKSNYFGDIKDPLTQTTEDVNKLVSKYKQGEVGLPRVALGTLASAAKFPTELALSTPLGEGAGVVGKAAGALPTVLKESVGQTAKGIGGKLFEEGIGSVAKQGLKSAARGGTIGAGLDIQNQLASGEKIKPGQALLSGALGAGIDVGATTGLPLLGQTLSKGIKGTKLAGKLSGVLNTTDNDITKAYENVSKEYERALPFSPTEKRKEAERLARSGENIFTTLSKQGIPLKQSADGKIDPVVLDHLDDVNSLFADTANKISKEEKGYFNLSEILDNAYKNIDSNLKSATARRQAKQKIQNEVSDLFNEGIDSLKNEKGQTLVKIDTADRLRQIGNSWTPFNSADPEKIGQSTGYALADAVRKNVEKDATIPSTRQFYKEWGHILHAKEKLSNLIGTGKTMKTVGGLSGEIARKVLTGGAGFHTGGFGGMILSQLGGDYLAKVFSDPEIRTMVNKTIIENADKKINPNIILQKIQSEIDDVVRTRSERPQLPAAKYMEGQPYKGINREPIVVGGNTPPKDYEEAQQIKKGLLSNDFKGMFKNQRGFIENSKSADNLSTKILEDLKGKTTVSKQYILDATNRGELKQVERDITRQVLEDMTRGSDNPLIQEAKKYKSAEEFVRAQDTFYRGEGGKDIAQGKALMAEGRHFAMDSEYPKRFGTVSEYAAKPGAKVFDASGLDYPEIRAKLGLPNTGKISYISQAEYTKALKAKGYDILKYDGTYQSTGKPFVHTVEITPNSFITKSQLTDIYNQAQKSDTINVKEFADKVKSELLPLDRGGLGYNKYENITLPGEIRGDVKNYREHIYNSPIQTSAGDVHFSGTKNNAKNYFGHTRIEDMADNKTRRVIEVQSDLYQKGNLERELSTRDIIDRRKYAEQYPDSPATPGHLKLAASDEKNILKEKGKLQQYNDPTAHFRMVREEVKKAAEDGKTKLQFPTGETAMKIEGLGDNTTWFDLEKHFMDDALSGKLSGQDLSVGKEVSQGVGRNADKWIITDVLGDGKFKAVPKSTADMYKFENGKFVGDVFDNTGKKSIGELPEHNKETFDISGKVDTNNPIYKFYEKDMGKYLKSKYNAVPITDNNGVTWYQVDIKPEYKEQPVLAFGKTKVGLLPKLAAGQTALLGGIYGASKLKNNQNNKKEETPSKKGLLINP